MKSNKIIFSVIFLIFLIQLASATIFTIDIKDSFTIGEEISFNYTILSDVAKQVEYIASVNCPNAPLSLLELKNVSLQAGVPFVGNYIYMSSIDESIEPQICRAVVGIISSEEISEEKSFEIIANPSFSFDIILSKKFFIKEENIYLDYTSDVSDLDIIANLIYPDKSKKEILIPSSIKAGQIGTYSLEVSASKEGYKTATSSLQFGVIEKDVDIEDADISSEDSQEVLFGHKVGASDESNIFNYLIYSLMVIIVIVLIVIIVHFKKWKSGQLTKKKLGLQKELKKGLEKKKKIIEKKEKRLLKRLFHRKEKLAFGKKQELDEKIKQEKKVLRKEKVGVRKEFNEKLKQREKLLEKKETKIIESEKVKEIRRLLSVGRKQLSMGNKEGAKNTYVEIRRLYGFLKSGEKNKDLYNHILIFHERLNKKVK